ncbi:MAG: VCBS repeat-containing protein [Planctomycetaceae bacterium]|nr:VCBS repeat-containing protein [Planctomycetaceae bacterium]
MRRWFVLLASALTPLFAFAQTELAEWNGTSGGQLGQRVVGAGDLDRDGTPDFALGERDSIRVISGRTRASLHTFVAPQPGRGFGKVFEFGDCNGDGWPDLIASAPGTSTFGPDSGTVWVISGRNLQPLLVLHGTTPTERFGETLVLLGDVTLDGREDFAVSSPGWNSATGRVRVFSGSNGTTLLEIAGTQPYRRFGEVMASVGNVAGDARRELGVALRATAYLSDEIEVWSLESNTLLHTLITPQFRSFGCVGDANSDGLDDMILLPHGPGTYPTFRLLYGGGGIQGAVASDTIGQPAFELGFSGLADYDGDGLAQEILVGVNDEYLSAPGEVRIYRGLQRIGTIYDATNSLNDAFGQSLAPVGDLDGNGSVEFVVGAPNASEVLHSYGDGRAVLLSAVTPAPVEYCTAKPNGLGCVPNLSHTGSASLTGASSLTIAVDGVLNRKSGLCLWGPNRQELPFEGGYLCVAAPFRRGSLANSGGSAAGDDCTGRLQFQFSAPTLWLHGVNVGDLLRAQFWYRDPLHVDGTGVGLSSAFEIRIGW